MSNYKGKTCNLFVYCPALCTILVLQLSCEDKIFLSYSLTKSKNPVQCSCMESVEYLCWLYSQVKNGYIKEQLNNEWSHGPEGLDFSSRTGSIGQFLPHLNWWSNRKVLHSALAKIACLVGTVNSCWNGLWTPDIVPTFQWSFVIVTGASRSCLTSSTRHAKLYLITGRKSCHTIGKFGSTQVCSARPNYVCLQLGSGWLACCGRGGDTMGN